MSRRKEETILQVQISSDESEDDICEHQTKPKRKYVIRIWRIFYWLMVLAFIVGVISCVATLTTPSLKKKVKPVMGLEIWQWCVLITTILAGPVLMKALDKLVFITITAQKLVNNPIYYTVMLIDNIWVATYFCYVLLAWTLVNDPKFMGIGKDFPPQTKENILIKFDKANRIISSTLITILIGTFLWFVKNAFLLVLEENFRIKRFFKRAKDSLMNEYWIRTLAGVGPRNGASSNKGVLSYDKYVKGSNKIKGEMDLRDLEKLNKDNVSRWMMKLIDMVIDERPLVYVVNDKEIPINSKKEAKVVANIIFNHLVLHGADQDHPCDMAVSKEELEKSLNKYFNEDHASKVMQWFERVGNNNINKDLFIKCTVRAWNNRNLLVRSMRSNKKIFQKFNLFVNVMLAFIIIIVWLVMIKEEIRRAMYIVGSAIVGSAFIFADLSRKLLESLVFIFVAHPFDVGDYCLINDTPVTIHDIHPLSTVALTLGNEKRYFPNSTLIGSTITNYTRSPPQVEDQVIFFLDISTPEQKLDKLKSSIKRLLKDNRQYWFPKYSLVMEFILGDSTPVIRATLQFVHKLNYDEIEEKEDRKNKFFLQFKKILEEENLMIKSQNN